jgi:peptide/nickel transport system permease protein
LELTDSRLPPAWAEEGSLKYLLGTDDQGRDILSALMYGTRISLVVGLASVLLSILVGGGLGLGSASFADGR